MQIPRNLCGNALSRVPKEPKEPKTVVASCRCACNCSGVRNWMRASLCLLQYGTQTSTGDMAEAKSMATPEGIEVPLE